MFRHYLLTAFRSILRHKAFTAINLLGLSLGLASALMLFVFIYNQSIKDQNVPNLDRLVRLEGISDLRANEGYNTRIHPGIGPALLENIPQVEAYLRVNGFTLDVTQDKGGFKDNLLQGKFLEADSSFFELFPQEFVLGNAATALSDKKSVVITESMARQLFGEENPIGQQINTSMSYRSPLTVSALIKDPNPTSSVQFGFVYAMDNSPDLSSNAFSPFATYLRVLPDTDRAALEETINKTIAPLAEGPYMQSFSYRLSTFDEVKYDLLATDNVVTPADQNLLLIFTIVALFILVLAVINYINLSASKALQSARQAGIRKIIGAGKGSFYWQFITESVLLCLITLPVALVIFTAGKPYFEAALDVKLTVGLMHPVILLSILSLVLITGFTAGVYPALLISRFRFREFINGNLFTNQRGASFRRLLVIFQFAIAILLIICAAIVQQQLRYFHQQQIRYNPEQIVVLDRGVSTKYKLLQQELNKLPGVLQSSLTSSPPGGDNYASSGGVMRVGEVIYTHNIDEQYADMLNLEFISGENYDKEKTAELNNTVIINETLAKLLEAANPFQMEKPLEGKYQFRYSNRSIKGIVKDFHIESLHEKIKPMVFIYEKFEGINGAYVMLKINTQNITNTLEAVESLWHQHLPDIPFRYTFLDQRFEKLYTAEMRLSRVFNVFTGMAMVISCLGLYGLISFMVAARSKEVGIRKVLGATVSQIIGLFAKKIYGLILVASLVAIPLAYWAMRSWLQDFAYHVTIQWTVFLWSILGITITGLLAVFSKLMHSANTNPVEVLKSE